MKDRMLKLGVAALVALAIPTVVVLAHGANDAQNGLATAASHAPANPPDDPGAPAASANRPHNHGWFISQAAKDHSTTGKAHGQAVSAVAKGTEGKPSAASH